MERPDIVSEDKDTLDLWNCLNDTYKIFETRQDENKRIEVINKLNQIIQTWVKEVFVYLGKDEMMVSSAFCKLNSFGSYRLGVHSPGTDIDLLVVGPSCVAREDHFFGKDKSHFKKSLY